MLGTQGLKGSNKQAIYVEIDLESSELRKDSQFQALRVKQALSKKNVTLDRQLGRASVVKDLKFKNKWFGTERVDDPTAEPFTDLKTFQAVASDLAALYHAYPGQCKIVRLRRPIQQSTYTEDRNAWMEQLARNQGEFLRQLVIQFQDVHAEDITVELQFAPSDAPAGMFYFVLPLEQHESDKKKKEEQLQVDVQRIVTRKNITFDVHTGRATFAKALTWEPRNPTGPKPDAPTAQFVNPAACDSALQDMAELWKLLRAPARIVTEAPRVDGDAFVEEWAQTLARNRAAVIKKAMVYYKVPAEMLTSGIFGDAAMSPRVPIRSDSLYAAGAVSAAGDKDEKLERLRVRAMLQKAVGVHRTDDIPLLEEALLEARKLRMEEQWTRVDSLVSDAAKNLMVLYQRRRRQEANAGSLDRKKALSKIKVSHATKQTMMECGEYRVNSGTGKPISNAN